LITSKAPEKCGVHIARKPGGGCALGTKKPPEGGLEIFGSGGLLVTPVMY